jgi:hypothetical protein
VLASAYDNPDLLASLLEDTDDNSRNLSGALRDAAGGIIHLKEASMEWSVFRRLHFGAAALHAAGGSPAAPAASGRSSMRRIVRSPAKSTGMCSMTWLKKIMSNLSSAAE